MHPPAHSARSRPPRFLGQALLIVLPVAVLTVVGLLSLRQDRLLAEQEARERAGRLAQEAADRALTAVFSIDPIRDARTLVSPGVDLFRPVFELTFQGELDWPPPVEPIPEPCPLDPAELGSAAREAWETARRATEAGDASAAVEVWTAFLAMDAPAAFAGNALFELAQAEARRGATNEAEARFRQVAEDHTTARGESGLPLAPLARWRADELALASAPHPVEGQRRFVEACSNLVFHPTALTPVLLERVAGLSATQSPSTASPATTDTPGESPSPSKAGRGGPAVPEPASWGLVAPPRSAWETNSLPAWRRLWETTELSRALFAAARRTWEQRGLLTANGSGATELQMARAGLAPLWVTLSPPSPDTAGTPALNCASRDWLCLRFPPSGRRFLGRSECEVSNLLEQASAETASVPPYFEVSFTVAGRTLSGPREATLLAERAADSSAQPGTAEPILKAAIHLTDPGALYARQRQRTWWFVALVLVAAATAGVGLFSAHRAFQRQLRLNELKSNFVSSVSHELRAPIASVRLLAESLDRGTVTDEARRSEYFQLMGQECRRLSALIENVLDFSRIDQGRKQYEFESTDLPALVSQTVRLMEPYAAERHVSLKLVLPPRFNLQPALDARAIQQALVNLIDNAVKHSPPGKTVAVSLEPSAEPAAPANAPDRQPPTANRQPTPPSPASGIGYRPSAIGYCPSVIRLAITDEGPGIPPDDHTRIFEPFYRRGSELRRETPGIGIGLSIVQHVVTAHGGRVWVESTVGRGSRFVVELPCNLDC